ncbi:MAG TPA: hypothetical protein VLF18_06825 [Tahibacter sp.]|uniref:hypothetical protein n=1 Tax=Tahibacter sp. TaxID=2056211 RepID=UPI002CB08B95|nr:hypothetical protein [Tahibacter sp.]HSX59894.1 hypothetical protein [Tahibacter sp.]
MFRTVGLAVTAIALAGLSACAARPTAPPARIAIVDRPNAIDQAFRYVHWNGEHYSPRAFADAARRAGIRLLEADGNPEHAACIAALAGALKLPLRNPGPADSGRGAQPREPSLQACEIGDKAGPVDPAYFRHRLSRRDGGVVLDDDTPATARAVVAKLRGLRARELVAEPVSTADLLCFDAIAREAELPLRTTGAAGARRDAGVRSGQMLEEACDRVR